MLFIIESQTNWYTKKSKELKSLSFKMKNPDPKKLFEKRMKALGITRYIILMTDAIIDANGPHTKESEQTILKSLAELDLTEKIIKLDYEYNLGRN